MLCCLPLLPFAAAGLAAPADLDVIRILDFYPRCGPAGTRVTILGLHLSRQYPLAFGGVVTGNWVLVSDRIIEAVVPEGAVTGPISLGPYASRESFEVTGQPCTGQREHGR